MSGCFGLELSSVEGLIVVRAEHNLGGKLVGTKDPHPGDGFKSIELELFLYHSFNGTECYVRFLCHHS